MQQFLCGIGGCFLLVLGLAAQAPVAEPQKPLNSGATASPPPPSKKRSATGKKGTPTGRGTANQGTSKSTGSKSGVAAPAVSSAHPSVSKSPASASNSKSAASRKGTTAKRPATAWHSRQLAPTPQRYKEIQQALAAKGYLKPEDATGKWDDNSVEALKKFQAEQNLDVTGKINSLSLIALGLGPKHDTASAQSSPH